MIDLYALSKHDKAEWNYQRARALVMCGIAAFAVALVTWLVSP